MFKKLGIEITDAKDLEKNIQIVDAILGIQKKVEQNKVDQNKVVEDKEGQKNRMTFIKNMLRKHYNLKSDNPPVSNETKVTTKKDKEIVKPVDNEKIVDNTKYNSKKEAEAQAKKTGVYGVYLYKNPDGRIVKYRIRNKTQ